MHACTVQSLLRTAEALGVQHVHIVESVCTFQLPVSFTLLRLRASMKKCGLRTEEKCTAVLEIQLLHISCFGPL